MEPEDQAEPQAESNNKGKVKVAAFSTPKFALPERPPKRAKNGGIPIIRVEYTYGHLAFETAIWENEEWNEREGVFETSYSVSLPRNVRAIPNDPISQATVAAFRDSTVRRAMDWYDKVNDAREASADKNAPVLGRLVRKRQPTESEAAKMKAAAAK